MLTNEQLMIIGHKIKVISRTSTHIGEYGKVVGTTKNKEYLKVQLQNTTINLAYSSVMQIN